jgi:hypothetical protein
VIIFASNFACPFNSKSKNINPDEFPITHNICKSFERVSDKFTQTNENFREAYIFENEKIPLNLETRPCINRTMFTVDFFSQHATKLYRLKYSDFYDRDDNLIEVEIIRETTGINFTVLQIFAIRGACSVARIKYKKRDLVLQKCMDIQTFFYRKKRGSSHIRKLLGITILLDTSRNISRFANIVDIIISGEQSKILNQLWTSNIFDNRERTFLFKLYNNILGYNTAVAHFVRNHSPNCTFCDIRMAREENRETPVHLFYDCESVSSVIDNVFKSITNNENFLFNRREYFATFDRRESSFAMNKILTLISTFIKIYIWDCRNRNYTPNENNCLENISERIRALNKNNKQFNKLWVNSGFLINNP